MDKYIFSDPFISQIENIIEVKPTDEEIKKLTN